MVEHIAFEMQHLNFWGWGDIQEGVGYEHLEFKRAVWAREGTESSMKGVWSCAHQEKTVSVVKSTDGGSNCRGSTPLHCSVTLSKLFNISASVFLVVKLM